MVEAVRPQVENCLAHRMAGLNNCQIFLGIKMRWRTIDQGMVSHCLLSDLFRMRRVILMFWTECWSTVVDIVNHNITIVHRWLMCWQILICMWCTMDSDMVFKAPAICKLTSSRWDWAGNVTNFKGTGHGSYR